MAKQQHNLYKNVFGSVKAATGYSDPFLAADFDEIQFVLQFGLILTISNVAVAEFEVGEVVTGAPSGATGVVLAVTPTTLKLGSITGTFTGADTILGGTSGATADVDSVSVANFTIGLFKSNQDNMTPPDPSLPSGPDNVYEQVMYTAEPGGVNYDWSSPFNPNTGSSAGTQTYLPQSFKADTRGAMWVFLKVLAYTGGLLTNADIDLFNNN